MVTQANHSNATLYLHNVTPSENPAEFANKKSSEVLGRGGSIQEMQDAFKKGMQGSLTADFLVAKNGMQMDLSVAQAKASGITNDLGTMEDVDGPSSGLQTPSPSNEIGR